MARRVKSSAKRAVHGKSGRQKPLPGVSKNIQGGNGGRVPPSPSGDIHGNNGKG